MNERWEQESIICQGLKENIFHPRFIYPVTVCLKCRRATSVARCFPGIPWQSSSKDCKFPLLGGPGFNPWFGNLDPARLLVQPKKKKDIFRHRRTLKAYCLFNLFERITQGYTPTRKYTQIWWNAISNGRQILLKSINL